MSLLLIIISSPLPGQIQSTWWVTLHPQSIKTTNKINTCLTYCLINAKTLHRVSGSIIEIPYHDGTRPKPKGVGSVIWKKHTQKKNEHENNQTFEQEFSNMSIK